MRKSIFNHVELVQYHGPKIIPCLKFQANLKVIPVFKEKSHEVAWLKYILDSGKIVKVSRLCNRCRRTLLDNEDSCSNCNTRALDISNTSEINILITNSQQIHELTISIQSEKNNFFYIVRRFLQYFPKEYINIFLENNIPMVNYPSYLDFPDLDDIETIDLLGTIFIDDQTKDTYILDFADIYEHPDDFYSEVALYVATGYKYGLGYVKVRQENFQYILERAMHWNEPVWRNSTSIITDVVASLDKGE